MTTIQLNNRTSVEIAMREREAIKVLIANGYEEAALYLIKAYFRHINKPGRNIIFNHIKDAV